MTDLTLTIGDKNLSSWSFRPWFALKQSGIAFTEQNIQLDRPHSKKELAEKSPSGLVPFLVHKTDSGDVKVWDSLAICEYVNELHPEKHLWPEDSHARAVARAVAAEMHSSFSTLRTVWPMMFLREGLAHITGYGVAGDIARIDALWTSYRQEFGGSGDFLFGEFSIADAFYAPVVSRFVTYGPVTISDASAAYMETIRGTAAYKEWGEGAKAELAA